MANKITKAEKIRRYISKNPNASAREVAEAAGASAPQVYGIIAKMKSEAKSEAKSGAPVPIPVFAETPAPKATDVAKTLKERGDRYGTFVAHAHVTQELKGVIYEHAVAHGKTFTADQMEAIDMICHKLGRIVNGDPNYADSWIDIAGYAKLVADRLETGLIV